MTTLAERLPTDEIAGQAAQARPGRAIATIITALFFAIGWVAGSAWYGLAFCVAAVRYGYRQGAHVQRDPAPSRPPRAEELSKL